MAEQNTQNVINQALSAGDLSPSDALATNTNKIAVGEDEVGERFASGRDQSGRPNLDLQDHDTRINSSPVTNGLPSVSGRQRV